MPILDPNRIYDGYQSLEGGADAGRRPNLIAPNQVAVGRNVIFRGGAPTNRLPFTKLSPSFDNPDLSYYLNGAYEGIVTGSGQSMLAFTNGVLQSASYYSLGRGREYLMASINGRLFQLSPGVDTVTIHEIPLDRRNNKTLSIAYMVQADVYHITQDGYGSPIIFDGTAARRAMQSEIFTGTIMAYGMNRIVLKGKDGLIYFGDIRDGKGNGGADVLGFTETQFLNEGFPSAIPSTMGEPTAIAFIPQQDTATGVGECLIWGESGVESFYLSIPRDEWKDSQFQRTALLGSGNRGHRNLAVVNEDIWFRAADGWRSYRQARAEVDHWGQIPMSTNVRPWTNNDTPDLLAYGSAISFDNRLITTCSPQPNQGRPFHNGLLALDFDVLSSFGNSTDPAWDGHWSNYALDPLAGARITQLVTGKFNGKERAFAFAIDTDGDNVLMEIQRDPVGDDTDGAIVAEIESRSMDFTTGGQSSADNEKLLYGGDIWMDGMSDSVSLTAQYRPDQVQSYIDWGSFTVQPIAGGTQFVTVPGTALGYAPRRSLQKPADDADQVTGRIWRRGYEFQAKLRWTGRAILRRFRVHAQQLVEDSKAKV